MADIRRYYPDDEVLAKLKEIRPDISFGERTQVKRIDVEPPTGNAAHRVMVVELAIPLDYDSFDRVFSDPAD